MVNGLAKRAAASTGQGAAAAGGSLHLPRLNESPPFLDEVLGTVAHELQSLLASRLAGVYMLTCEYPLDTQVRRTLLGMEQQLQRAMRLVDDLFDALVSTKVALSGNSAPGALC